MGAPKHIVAKIKDIQAALSLEEIGWFNTLLTKIGEYRRSRVVGRRPENPYVVLNLTDPFAVIAIEAYIRAAESHPNYETSVYLKNVVEHMRTMKHDVLLTQKERLPDD